MGNYMQTFKEFLVETGIAGHGNWTPKTNELTISEISDVVITTQYTLKKTFSHKLGEFSIFKKNNTEIFLIAYYNKNGDCWDTVCKIELSSFGKVLNWNDTYRVAGVMTHDNVQGHGFGLIMYTFIVNDLDYKLVGDVTQYFGARRLWAKISKMADFNVDIVDVKNDVMIHQNVKLHQGKLEPDFDERLWARDDSKVDILPVMTKVITR